MIKQCNHLSHNLFVFLFLYKESIFFPGGIFFQRVLYEKADVMNTDGKGSVFCYFCGTKTKCFNKIRKHRCYFEDILHIILLLFSFLCWEQSLPQPDNRQLTTDKISSWKLSQKFRLSRLLLLFGIFLAGERQLEGRGRVELKALISHSLGSLTGF